MSEAWHNLIVDFLLNHTASAWSALKANAPDQLALRALCALESRAGYDYLEAYASLRADGRLLDSESARLLSVDMGLRILQPPIGQSAHSNEALAALARLLGECEDAIQRLSQVPDRVFTAFYLRAKAHCHAELGELIQAAAIYEDAIQQFTNLEGEHAPPLSPTIAELYGNLSVVRGNLGGPERAIAAVNVAIEIQSALAADRPKEHLTSLAESLSNRANIHLCTRNLDAALRDLEDAHVHARRALDIGVAGSERLLAGLLGNRGIVKEELDNIAGAATDFQDSLKAYVRLDAQSGGRYSENIARTRFHLGHMKLDLGRAAEAIEEYESSLAMYEVLANSSDAYVAKVALCLDAVGKAEMERQNYSGAVQPLVRALEIMRALLPFHSVDDQTLFAGLLSNAGCARRDTGRVGDGRALLEESLSYSKEHGLLLRAAEAAFNIGKLSLGADVDDIPGARTAFRTCVINCETLLTQSSEREHRDILKRRLEYAYVWLIEDAARRPDSETSTEDVIRLLESVRRIEAISDIGFATLRPNEGPNLPTPESLASLDAALLWIQTTPNGTVFALITPWNGFQMVFIDDQIIEDLRQMHVGVWTMMEANCEGVVESRQRESLRAMGIQAFSRLPAIVQDELDSGHTRLLFLLPCANTVNLPWELLHTSTGASPSYIGLRRQMPRLNGVFRIADVLSRSPNVLSGRSIAIVVGDPTGDLDESCNAAEQLQSLLKRGAGFRLLPTGNALTGENATTEALESALEMDFSLWVQLGHGGWKPLPHFVMAGYKLVSPRSILRHEWPQHPIVHFGCCFTGVTLPEGGGRFMGHITAAMRAGASCVLASASPLFDSIDAEFCLELYERALDAKHPTTVGEALLATRREMAARHGDDPLVWCQYALWGNPWAKLVA